MKKTLLSLFAFSGLLASAQITDVALSSSQTTVTIGNGTTITTDGSQLGYNYLLRDNSDNSLIGFPVLGTGGDLTFNTGPINVNTTYNVLASNAITLQLNNNSSSISFTNNSRTIDKEITVAAWVKTTGPNGLLRNIVQQYGGTGEDAGYILRMNTQGKVSFTGRDQSTNYRTSGESAVNIADDQWHYVVGSANVTNGLWSIYVDGNLENSQVNTGGVSLTTSSSILKIGGTFSTSKAIIGDVRDVTIWNRTLLASEVTSNFSGCISGSEVNVVGHFPLNEGQGSTILDYSSIAINGTANYLGSNPYPWITETTTCRDSLLMSQLITVNVSNSILVNSINVQGQGGASVVTTDYGTLQMEATTYPTNADDGSYTWSVINGTGSATISANGILSDVHNGTVTVKATANDISGTSGTAIINISNQSVEISESLNKKVKVYPNPVENQLFIDLEKLQAMKINIVDYSGRIIKEIISSDTKSIDVSELKQGIYLLKIYTKGNIYTNQFIKK